MSSAENGRLVYVNAADLSLHDELLAQVVRLRHGRAPADPAGAVRAAVSVEWMHTGMGNEERIDDVYDREGAAIYRANLVLTALGVPDVPQRPTPRDETS